MTEQEINIAIAKSQGIENITNFKPWREPVFVAYVDADGKHVKLPDYCNDLNAMYDTEKTLNIPKKMRLHAWNNYSYLLDQMTHGSAFHATARQRAEAYLKTIGKWKQPTI